MLIIDADNVRRGMLACTLPTARYALEFAKTKEAGLDKIHDNVPSIILIGESPETRNLCEHIRSLPTTRACILILLREASPEGEEAPTGSETLGADHAISFPFTLDAFADTLSDYDQGTLAIAQTIASPSVSSSPAVDTTEGQDKKTTQGSDDDTSEMGWSIFRDRVHVLYGNLDHLDYYAILDVGADATGAQVKDAYFKRSTAYHPDRFMQLDDPELRHQIYEIFKRATEAFKILLDPDTRGLYDKQIADTSIRDVRYRDPKQAVEPALGEDDDLARTPAGRKYANLAERAERNGKLKSARMYLTLASQCEPLNAPLRSHLENIRSQLAH